MLKRWFLTILILLAFVWPVKAETPKEEPIRLPVVMYHHISKNPTKWNDYVISPVEFAEDLRWLREHGYTSIGVSELMAWLDGEFVMPEKPCIISFDDGAESTAAYAEPLLAQYGFHGVAAVIGSVCEKFSWLDEHDPELSNLSWEDAAAMAERGVLEIQCHSWDMHSLWPRKGCARKTGEGTEAYRTALQADLARYLAACRQYGVAAMPAIAYPYGAYSAETEAIVRQMGFRAAFTCTEKINLLTGAADELYDLGRFNRAHGISSEKFFSKWEEKP